MTLKEHYQHVKEKPTPAQEFIRQIADATCREISTVRQWLSGVQEPNAKAKEKISEIVGLPVDELFPPCKSEESIGENKDVNETSIKDD